MQCDLIDMDIYTIYYIYIYNATIRNGTFLWLLLCDYATPSDTMQMVFSEVYQLWHEVVAG